MPATEEQLKAVSIRMFEGLGGLTLPEGLTVLYNVINVIGEDSGIGTRTLIESLMAVEDHFAPVAKPARGDGIA